MIESTNIEIINTIIKTDSNSNHAPNIKSIYLGNDIGNNGVIKLSYIPEIFNFDTIANDIDGDKVKLQVNIDGEETNSMISNGYEPEGTNFTANIPISKLKEVSRRENKMLNIYRYEQNVGLITKSIKWYRLIQVKYGSINT